MEAAEPDQEEQFVRLWHLSQPSRQWVSSPARVWAKCLAGRSAGTERAHPKPAEFLAPFYGSEAENQSDYARISPRALLEAMP